MEKKIDVLNKKRMIFGPIQSMLIIFIILMVALSFSFFSERDDTKIGNMVEVNGTLETIKISGGFYDIKLKENKKSYSQNKSNIKVDLLKLVSKDDVVTLFIRKAQSGDTDARFYGLKKGDEEVLNLAETIDFCISSLQTNISVAASLLVVFIIGLVIVIIIKRKVPKLVKEEFLKAIVLEVPTQKFISCLHPENPIKKSIQKIRTRILIAFGIFMASLVALMIIIATSSNNSLPHIIFRIVSITISVLSLGYILLATFNVRRRKDIHAFSVNYLNYLNSKESYLKNKKLEEINIGLFNFIKDHVFDIISGNMIEFYNDGISITTPDIYRDNPIDYLSKSIRLDYSELNLFIKVKYNFERIPISIFICSNLSDETKNPDDILLLLDNKVYSALKEHNVLVEQLDALLGNLEEDIVKIKFKGRVVIRDYE